MIITHNVHFKSLIKWNITICKSRSSLSLCTTLFMMLYTLIFYKVIRHVIVHPEGIECKLLRCDEYIHYLVIISAIEIIKIYWDRTGNCFPFICTWKCRGLLLSSLPVLVNLTPLIILTMSNVITRVEFCQEVHFWFKWSST